MREKKIADEISREIFKAVIRYYKNVHLHMSLSEKVLIKVAADECAVSVINSLKGEAK